MTLIVQKHFLWTIETPDSLYSSLVIHIVQKVDNDDKIDPPIHTEYFLSGGATILILTDDGANEVISFDNLSEIPGYMVVPPDKTIFQNKSLLTSTSHFMIDLKVNSWIPGKSFPTLIGANNASGHLNLQFPTVKV